MLLPLDVMDDRPYMTNKLESCWKQQMCLATRRETARFVTFLFFGFLATRCENTHINVFSNLNDSMAKETYWSGGPGESHPRAPTEPCLTVSRYTALVILGHQNDWTQAQWLRRRGH